MIEITEQGCDHENKYFNGVSYECPDCDMIFEQEGSDEEE